MASIADWLKTIDLEQYAALFAENEVDFRTLQILTDQDLQELDLPFGPRKRLLNAMAEFKRCEAAALDVARNEAAPGLHAGAAVTAVGERRQLTVLFCDMVGFTELASRLDPEDLQIIVSRYEDACAVCVTRYEGYVFQRLGDGIVAFFGFPLAHEGEAERAVHAGLAILETLADLDMPEAGSLKRASALPPAWWWCPRPRRARWARL
jgi:class 3 adenylate cyclase